MCSAAQKGCRALRRLVPKRFYLIFRTTLSLQISLQLLHNIYDIYEDHKSEISGKFLGTGIRVLVLS